MKNPATRPQNELNEFTNLFAMMDESWQGRSAWVRLRNGQLVRPFILKAENEHCEDAFIVREPFRMTWNLDGTSITRPDYDMMELIVK